MITTITSGHLLSKLTTLSSSSESLVLFFTATRKSDGSRWCPDCEAVDSTMTEAMETTPAGAQVLVIEVTRDEWKVDPGQNHFLRKEPFGVKGIPTLVKFDASKNAVTKRFSDPDMEQLELMTDFFSNL